MKILIFYIAFFLYINILQSQDLIVLNNGEKIKCTIIDTKDNKVKYQIYKSDSITFLTQANIQKIIYRNGEKTTFDDQEKTFEIKPLGCHKIDVDFPNFIFRYLSFGYEFFPANNNLVSIKIPITTRLKFDFLETALDFRFYFAKSRYTNIHIWKYRLGYGRWDFFSGPSIMYSKDFVITQSEISLRIFSGSSLQFRKNINFTIYAGVGPGYNPNKKIFLLPWNINITAGYRFTNSRKNIMRNQPLPSYSD